MTRAFVRVLASVLLLLQAGEALAANALLLRLTIYRPGTVRLDGEDWIDLTGTSGRAPVPWSDFSIQEREIAPGRHTLSLRPRDLDVLPPFETVVVEGAAGDTVVAELGRPELSTSPSGARVLVGGREAGTTPLRLEPGDLWGAEVLVDREGYHRVTIPGDSLLADTRLPGAKRIELTPLDATPEPVRLSEDHRSWWLRNKTLSIGASVTLLAAGVYTAVRFKDRADERYADYLRTGNPGTQKDYFDQAVRYDRLSLLGWAVGEAAFLATFFLIIHEEPRGLVPTAGVEPEPGSGAARYRVGVRRAF